MKKYLSVILGIILTLCLVACGCSGKASVNDNNQEKVAVMYFSGTGNTREVANLLAKEADIFEIIPEDMYTSDDLNYNDDNSRANQEMNDDSARPVISNDLSAVSEYDVVISVIRLIHRRMRLELG